MSNYNRRFWRLGRLFTSFVNDVKTHRYVVWKRKVKEIFHEENVACNLIFLSRRRLKIFLAHAYTALWITSGVHVYENEVLKE